LIKAVDIGSLYTGDITMKMNKEHKTTMNKHLYTIDKQNNNAADNLPFDYGSTMSKRTEKKLFLYGDEIAIWQDYQDKNKDK
jgi:hypothetical protein